MNPNQFYRMLMKPENRKISKMVLGVLLTVSLLLPYVTVFILNNFAGASDETTYSAKLNQDATPITKWEQGESVSRPVSVTNTGLKDSNAGNVYARVRLREYLETGTANVTKSEERLLVGSNGKFLSYDTEEAAKEAYPDREAKKYTAVGETKAKWYVVAGNGVTGQYLTLSTTVTSPTKVPSGATKGTPSSYAVHKWASPATGDTATIGNNVTLGLGNPVAAAFKGKTMGALVTNVSGYDWRVVRVDGSGNMLVVTDKIVGSTTFKAAIPYATYYNSYLDIAMREFYAGATTKSNGATWVGSGLNADWWAIAKPVTLPTEAQASWALTGSGYWSSVRTDGKSVIFGNDYTGNSGKTCFALSYAEMAATTAEGFYFNNTNGNRIATDLAGNGNTSYLGYWWSRSPGSTPGDAAGVYSGGNLNTSYVAARLGLRPALWINPNGVQNLADWDGSSTASWILDTNSADGWAYWGQPLEPGQTTGNLLSSVTLTKKPAGAFYYAVNAQMEAVSGDEVSKWSGVPDAIKGAVTVSPSTAKVNLGDKQDFDAEVTGLTKGKDVTWSVKGATPVKSDTTIDEATGELSVSDTELIGNELTVTATSLDGVVKGTATVKVVPPPPPILSNPVAKAFRKANVGDIVRNQSGYDWRVLKIDGSNGNMLVVTDGIVNGSVLNTAATGGTDGWAFPDGSYDGSTLDKAMKAFYNGTLAGASGNIGLSDNMRGIAVEVTLPAETESYTSYYPTASWSGGLSTAGTGTKKCFALSVGEVKEYFGLVYNGTSAQTNQANAIAKVVTGSNWGSVGAAVNWLLRSGGISAGNSAAVYSAGNIGGGTAATSRLGVRPALWINPYPDIPTSDMVAGDKFVSSGYFWRVLKKDSSGNLLVVTDKIVGSTQYRTAAPYNPGYRGSQLDLAMQAFYNGGLKPSGVTWAGTGLTQDMRDIALIPTFVGETTDNSFEDWNNKTQDKYLSSVVATAPASPNGSSATGPTCFALSSREVATGQTAANDTWINPSGMGDNALRAAADITGNGNTALPGFWWLRSAGPVADDAAVVSSGGTLSSTNVTGQSGLRPAMWVKPYLAEPSKDMVAGDRFVGSGYGWVVLKKEANGNMLVTTSHIVGSTQYKTSTPYNPGYRGSQLDLAMQAFYNGYNSKKTSTLTWAGSGLDDDMRSIAQIPTFVGETTDNSFADYNNRTQDKYLSSVVGTAPSSPNGSSASGPTCFALSSREVATGQTPGLDTWINPSGTTATPKRVVADLAGNGNTAAPGHWWLRSAGYSGNWAAYVYSAGNLYFYTVTDQFGLRPALWINLGS